LRVRTTFEIAAHEAVFMNADVEGHHTGIFDRRHTVFLHQGKHPKDAANAHLSLLLVDQLAELADGDSRMFGATQQLRGAERHLLGVIFFLDAISATFLAQLLPKKLACVRMQDAHVQLIPLHFDQPPDPFRRQAVIGGLHFHATVQMHHPFSVLVIAERFQREWQQVRFFFGEHGRHLSFRRAMDARVRPALLPAVQIRLRFLQALEPHPFERRFLGVADSGLYFPFAIRIPDPARQGHHPIVGEHIAKQWINRRIVDVRNQHAFFQVVENHDSRTATESAQSFLMEFCPDARTRTPRQQADRFAAVSHG
jgi:hypothetical protein